MCARADEQLYLVSQLRHRDDDQLFVYGRGFGSALANRYLQLAPQPMNVSHLLTPTGVIMESACPAGLCAALNKPAYAELAGENALYECSLDDTCLAQLGVLLTLRCRFTESRVLSSR